MPGRVLHDLHALWQERGKIDEYMGTLVNAWLDRGGQAPWAGGWVKRMSMSAHCTAIAKQFACWLEMKSPRAPSTVADICSPTDGSAAAGQEGPVLHSFYE